MSGGISTRIIGSGILRSYTSNKIKKTRKPSFSRDPPEVREYETDHSCHSVPGGSGPLGRGTSPRREPPASRPTLRLPDGPLEGPRHGQPAYLPKDLIVADGRPKERKPIGSPRRAVQYGGSSGSTGNDSGSMGPPPLPNTYFDRGRPRGSSRPAFSWNASARTRDTGGSSRVPGQRGSSTPTPISSTTSSGVTTIAKAERYTVQPTMAKVRAKPVVSSTMSVATGYPSPLPPLIGTL